MRISRTWESGVPTVPADVSMRTLPPLTPTIFPSRVCPLLSTTASCARAGAQTTDRRLAQSRSAWRVDGRGLAFMGWLK